jgi:large subunit ribosomal protein L31
MQKEIQPKVNDIVASCACGAKFDVGSVLKEIHVDICSACHPFYTGESRLLDTEGRVERFKKRAAMAKAAASK